MLLTAPPLWNKAYCSSAGTRHQQLYFANVTSDQTALPDSIYTAVSTWWSKSIPPFSSPPFPTLPPHPRLFSNQTRTDCDSLFSFSLYSCLPCGSHPLVLTSEALLLAMYLMCSDTRDAGRGCAVSVRHGRNASHNHKLAPTNSASDINYVRHRVSRKWFHRQMAWMELVTVCASQPGLFYEGGDDCY